MNRNHWKDRLEEEAESELRFQEMMGYYGSQTEAKSQENIVGLLREVQEAYGYIPSEKIEEMAQGLEVKAAVFRQLIKLYPSFKKAPYQHCITVCTGVRCGAKGSSAVFNAVWEAAETRESGYFKVNSKECFKQCKTSPNIIVDDRLYGCVKPEEVASILEQY